MPMYTYVCPNCSYTDAVKKSMAHSDRSETCPECDSEMDRDLRADVPHVPADRYSSPIVSDALAMNPDQIAAHRRQFPDIKVTPQGQPVFDNYAKHDAYLETCNFKKMPKKKRARGTKINTKKEPTPSV